MGVLDIYGFEVFDVSIHFIAQIIFIIERQLFDQFCCEVHWNCLIYTLTENVQYFVMFPLVGNLINFDWLENMS